MSVIFCNSLRIKINNQSYDLKIVLLARDAVEIRNTVVTHGTTKSNGFGGQIRNRWNFQNICHYCSAIYNLIAIKENLSHELEPIMIR